MEARGNKATGIGRLDWRWRDRKMKDMGGGSGKTETGVERQKGRYRNKKRDGWRGRKMEIRNTDRREKSDPIARLASVHCVAKDDFPLLVLLPRSPEYWDDRRVPHAQFP